jgi:hypothetical protein
MTPSTTIGVASTPRVVGSSWLHTRPNWRTVESLICRRGLSAARCTCGVREPVGGIAIGGAQARVIDADDVAALVPHAASVTNSNIGARRPIRAHRSERHGRLPPADCRLVLFDAHLILSFGCGPKKM